MKFNKDSYYQEKFKGLVFEKNKVSEKEFEECIFVNCAFTDCKFLGCRFIGCKFSGCSLSANDFTDCHFVDVSFKSSKTIGVDWTKAARVVDLLFEDCQINYSNFSMIKLPKSGFTSCEAKEVDFSEADLSGSDFSGSDLKRSIFSRTNLVKADFRDAKNYSIDVKNNSVKGAKFSLPQALSLLDSFEVEIS